MLVYHFIDLKWGLDDLVRRRLKVARIDELNDPFEFYGANLSDPELRRAFRSVKTAIAQFSGILCFSRDWTNPVQWSHYADHHKGLCLGFEVPSHLVAGVNYSRKRFAINAQKLRNSEKLDPPTVNALLFTKFAHWQYENEVRMFVSLNETEREADNYYASFCKQLELNQVVVGAESKLQKSELLDALGELRRSVDVVKARLAFGSFRVVPQRNNALAWV